MFRCSVGKLIIEILKMVKSVKLIKKKGSRKSDPPGIGQKIGGGGRIWQFLIICLGVARGGVKAWN